MFVVTLVATEYEVRDMPCTARVERYNMFKGLNGSGHLATVGTPQRLVTIVTAVAVSLDDAGTEHILLRRVT
jgi:hypothetical protein